MPLNGNTKTFDRLKPVTHSKGCPTPVHPCLVQSINLLSVHENMLDHLLVLGYDDIQLYTLTHIT